MAKKLRRHSAPYSKAEKSTICAMAKAGKSARETAMVTGRTLGGLKFYALKHGISFHSIAQVSRQKALAKKRIRTGSMTVTL